MGPLTKIIERRLNIPLTHKKILEVLGGGLPSATGLIVTPDTAMRLSAVYACIRVISEGVAALPFFMYRRLGRGKDRATDQRLYSLLHNSPNPEMTALEFRETLMGHLLLRGNCYAYIDSDNQGDIAGLWPLRVDRVEPKRDRNNALYYEIFLPGGGTKLLPYWMILHIKGLSPDGLKGYSPITVAREAIGLGLAAEEYGARFFANSARPSVVLEHPNKLNDDAEKRLRNSWEKMHRGLDNAHRVAILEEGMKVAQIGLSPEDAQCIQTRKFQVNEIARIFRVQPHMIADLEHATFSNIEHQALEHVIHTLRPWLVRWEQRCWLQLLSSQEKEDFFFEHLVEGLLRGDFKTRMEGFRIGREMGCYSPNDVNEIENRNPIPKEEGGDTYHVPLNWVPAKDLENSDTPQEEKVVRELRSVRAVELRRRTARSFIPILKDAVNRIVAKEEKDVLRAARQFLIKRDKANLEIWLADYYAGQGEWVKTRTSATFSGLGNAIGKVAAEEIGVDAWPNEEVFMSEYKNLFAERYTRSSHNQLKEILAVSPDPLTDIQTHFDEWKEKRGDKVAESETVRTREAVAKDVFKSGGITKLTWVSSGKTCAFCSELNGKIVGIENNFIEGGSDFEVNGEILHSYSNVGHPPAHGFCDCGIAPV